jgi:hypothetical protein
VLFLGVTTRAGRKAEQRSHHYKQNTTQIITSCPILGVPCFP